MVVFIAPFIQVTNNKQITFQLSTLNINTRITEPEILKADIPSIIKYMGSKKPIIDFIVDTIQDIHSTDDLICDLFAGSCSISATLRKQYNFISNDIQEYSSILAHTYFSDLTDYDFNLLENAIKKEAEDHVQLFENDFSKWFYDYSIIVDLEEYQRIESSQRDLQKLKFRNHYHLFAKHYAGTYWSFEQCVWIDALRKSAESYKGQSVYFAIISSIMFAMSYCTQSTGHFAQYRDGNSLDAMSNIILYRTKNIYSLFIKKLEELVSGLDNHLKTITTTSLSYEDCLRLIPEGSTIYADPPYAPVHYSRFYHVLETLVKYDYPKLEFKGRYRTDRHQSPFSQKSNAIAAFERLFQGIINKRCQMILSYSGSGVVSIDKIISLAKEYFKSDYVVEVKEIDHKHSTMGRFEDHNRDVTEYLIIAKFGA